MIQAKMLVDIGYMTMDIERSREQMFVHLPEIPNRTRNCILDKYKTVHSTWRHYLVFGCIYEIKNEVILISFISSRVCQALLGFTWIN